MKGALLYLKKIISVVCIFLLILLLLSSCNYQQGEQSLDDNIQPEQRKDIQDTGPVKGGTLNLYSSNPDTLNPLFTKSKSNAEILNLVFNSLIIYDKNMNVFPSLAERWEVSPDGMTWTFFLRKDVKWHDNAQFTANDVDYTFKVLSSSKYDSIYKFNIQFVSYFSVVDEYTFKVVLTQPYGNFLEMMTFPIVAKHQFQGKELDGNTPDFKPIGTGPFKFVKYDPLKELRLKVNTAWWGENVPYIEDIIVKLVPDNNTALYALEAKEIDLVPTNVVDWEKYSGKGNIKIKEFITNYYEFIAVNFNNKVLSDKAVRKAIAYAIDRNKIINEVLLNHAKKSDVPVNPESWLYDPSSQIYDYDIQKAKEILNGAGWNDLNNDGVLDKVIDGVNMSLSFEIITNNDNVIRDKAATIIENQLKAVGMNVTVKKVAWNELNSILNSKNFDAVLSGLNLFPNSDLSFAFHSSEIERGTNFISYNNPQMDELLQQAFKAVDKEQRRQAYSLLQKQIAEELPYISLYFRTSAVLYNDRLRGDVNPIGTNIYNNIHKWYLLKE